MQKIICPHCKKEFELQDKDYQDLLSQVRGKEMESQIKSQVQAIEAKKEADLAKAKSDYEKRELLNSSSYEKKIDELKAKIASFEAEKKLALNEAERKSLEAISQKDGLIKELESKLKNLSLQAEAEKQKEISVYNEKLTKAQSDLALERKAGELKQKELEQTHKLQLEAKEEEIRQLKDFKSRESTKMVGEDLETYCHDQFEKVRAMAFPSAEFGKDNTVSASGSKGDFIFKDFDSAMPDRPYISIMFEMKNETDSTSTKKKNEDFFKELDKDRNEKGCEYAVLVSMLEKDSDLYNQGIVDVSHRYPKMYVIRPQFFIPLIGLLRNEARNSIKYLVELKQARSQSIDVVNFEENLQNFKTDFSLNFGRAKEKFDAAIAEIDKTIEHLQKVKDGLLGSEKNLRIANNKIDAITIRKLTKNAPSVKAAFDELKGD